MALIKWNKSVESGIAGFDEHNREFFSIVNSLDDALRTASRENAIRVILMKLNDHSTHLNVEEEFMQEIRFPGLKRHQEEHRDFGMHIEEFIHSYSSGKKVELGLLSFLTEWVINHIMAEDMACVEYAAGLGLIPHESLLTF